ncbi:hypothetical protein BHE74_00021975 [Ensete ventricosum]|nr:hypothetical protein BHE74_00021975 [Ensete ventricosum]
MSPSSSSNERNLEGCSPSGSSSSMDEKASKALEVMLSEHDEDSVISESFLPTLGLDTTSLLSTIRICWQSTRRRHLVRGLAHDRSQEGDSPGDPSRGGEQQTKEQGRISTSVHEGDLCRVRVHSQNEPYLAQEIADLPKTSREGLLEARWATLTPRSKVWADRANAQLFHRGVLYPSLAKEIYTTPSKTLLVDELFLIIDELRAKVRKLQEEADPVAVVAGETRASKTTQWLDKSQHRETEAQGQMQILDAQLQGMGDNMDVARSKARAAE